MDEQQHLVRLIYASSKGKYVDGVELKNILVTAQARNNNLGVTGALLFNGEYFLQVLEGNRFAVSNLFNHITQDSRHHNVQLISMMDVEQRKWSQWDMQLISFSDKEEQIYRKHTKYHQFNPFQFSSDQAVKYLIEISELNRVNIQ